MISDKFSEPRNSIPIFYRNGQSLKTGGENQSWGLALSQGGVKDGPFWGVLRGG